MSGKSGIQWTAGDDGAQGYVWNPVVGCTRVSAGCNHCYAFALHDQRHIAWKRGRWPSAPAQYHQPFSHVQLLPDRVDDPYHWRKPRRVFVNSMSDLFHPYVPASFINEVWMTMFHARRHTYQILTKRPERLREWTEGKALATGWPIEDIWPDWMWLGVSVEDQAAADERIPLLLQTPARVRFLSCEPLLGPVDLSPWLVYPGEYDKAECSLALYGRSQPLSWVIIGGESGKHARAMNPRWALSLVEQCHAAGAPVFVKQLGTELAYLYSLKDRHGGDITEWPPDFDKVRVREWPHSEM